MTKSPCSSILGPFQRGYTGLLRHGVVILVYHRVASSQGESHDLTVSAKHFAEHLEVLKRWGRPVTVRDLPRLISSGRLPRRGYAVTFDDGYADNLLNAKPLLESNETPATVFAASAYAPGGREYWWITLDTICRIAKMQGTNIYVDSREMSTDERAAFESELSSVSPESVMEHVEKLRRQVPARVMAPRNALPMNASQLHQLTANGLIDIGAHTVNHRRLARLTECEQMKEITDSKQQLEETLGRPVDTFAYPFGFEGSDFTRKTQELVRNAGYRCACSVRAFPVVTSSDCYSLPRCWVSDWDGEEFSRRLRFWYTR